VPGDVKHGVLTFPEHRETLDSGRLVQDGAATLDPEELPERQRETQRSPFKLRNTLCRVNVLFNENE